MKVKVCGLNNKENILGLKNASLDFMGFIFYEKSKRGISKGDLDEEFVKSITEAQKVGVFVDMPLEEIEMLVKEYALDFIQLHGDETPQFCKILKKKGYKTIKALSISTELPVSKLKSYQHVVDMFLLDTSGVDKGGNGIKFDWNVLNSYNLNIPFLLAGGISLEDAEEIKRLDLEMLYGVDINSRFEVESGIKDLNKVTQFIKSIK